MDPDQPASERSDAVYLETERLRLRRFTRDDVDDLVVLDADPAVMRYITGGTPTPRQEIENDVLPGLARLLRARFVGLLVAVEKPTRRPVG